jgi:glycosyltransferase involved in cell wall biosynthesis
MFSQKRCGVFGANAKPMKIIYVAVGRGGSDQSLLNTLDGIKGLPIEPVVAVHKQSKLISALKARRVPYLTLRYEFAVWPESRSLKDKIRLPLRLLRHLVINRRATHKLAAYVKANGIDLIHSNSGVLHIGFDAARRCGIPHVWHLREYQDLDMRLAPFPTRQNLLKKLRDPTTYNVAVTDEIFRHFDLCSENSCRIYNGVRSARQLSLPVEKEKYFLFVGTIAPHKGVSELVEAFIEFSRAEPLFELRIAGDIPRNRYFRSLIETIREHDLQDRIKFLGYCESIDSLMAKAAALIVPSRSEAFGRITAEAMFNGCLVIGKNVAGTKEQFDNGVATSGSEIALRYTTTSGLVQRMKWVAECDALQHEKLLEKAMKTVTRLYTIEAHAGQVQALYSRVLASNS